MTEDKEQVVLNFAHSSLRGFHLDLPLKQRKPLNIGFIQTFLCSEAVLGLSGVVFMLAGVAATGEEDVFSIMSAGIF